MILTQQILNTIIAKLHKASFTVGAIVNDMSESNMTLWSSMEIGHNKNCYFQHPSDNSLIAI